MRFLPNINDLITTVESDFLRIIYLAINLANIF